MTMTGERDVSIEEYERMEPRVIVKLGDTVPVYCVANRLTRPWKN